MKYPKKINRKSSIQDAISQGHAKQKSGIKALIAKRQTEKKDVTSLKGGMKHDRYS